MEGLRSELQEKKEQLEKPGASQLFVDGPSKGKAFHRAELKWFKHDFKMI